MHFPSTYQNGTYTVTTTSDGTRTYEDPTGQFKAEFPDTIDLKITNNCNAGCYYCHEGSERYGKHANFIELINVLERFPSGIELAIGGGNPLAYPMLDNLLYQLSNRFITNITVSGIHVSNKKNFDRLKRFQAQGELCGIGVSAITPGFSADHFGSRLFKEILPNMVGHVIPGLWGPWAIEDELKRLTSPRAAGYTYLNHYLVLGYKRLRRGESVEEAIVNKSIAAFREALPRTITYLQARGIKLSFDNLAIEQLGVKDIITPEVWNTHYMGDDGTRSMFIDAVEQISAMSSTSKERWRWYDIHPLEFFQHDLF